ncbi:NADP-dependent malic enzyme [Blomia tropicalis]|nr:NADP-dependent malic enzyme [Blomia tropicalis]
MYRKNAGISLLRDPFLNKGLAFSSEERDEYQIRGLLPPAIQSLESQIQLTMKRLNTLTDDLSKYQFLRDIQDFNTRLFFMVLHKYPIELMPLIYTPTVGLACQRYSLIYRRPRGLFITINDAGKVFHVLSNYTIDDVKAIVVTDGERILGLGDLGANGMGIPVGKIALYTSVGGIAPNHTLPIMIDVGTNNQTLLDDSDYIGLKQRRTTGDKYMSLLDEFMNAVVRRWSSLCLIQFEDFGNQNAWHLLERYSQKYCTFNDDIQGTAAVIVAAILAAIRITKTKLQDNRFLFFGAGEAGLGAADLLVNAINENGLQINEAINCIYLIDTKGLITVGRQSMEKNAHKDRYAKRCQHSNNLLDILDIVRPTALIGLAAQPSIFNQLVLSKMASINRRPIIMALSNPTSKAECTAEQAYIHTEGRAVFASGSPFGSVTIGSTTFHPGQCNNVYIFPAIAAATIHCKVNHIPNHVFLVAAKALAEQVTEDELVRGSLFPSLISIRETSLRIATRVAEWFYVQKLSNLQPEPLDKYHFLKDKMYNPFNENHS